MGIKTMADYTIYDEYQSYSSGSHELTNAIFSGIHYEEGQNGGAIQAVSSASLTITGSTFADITMNDTGSYNGGAIYASGSASLTITNTLFKGIYIPQTNTPGGNHTGGGAALYMTGTSKATISRSTFSDNTTRNGACIYVLTNATLTITDSSFTNNIPTNAGAGNIRNGGTLTVSNISISNETTTMAILNEKTLNIKGLITLTNNYISTGVNGTTYIDTDAFFADGDLTKIHKVVDTNNYAGAFSGSGTYTAGEGFDWYENNVDHDIYVFKGKKAAIVSDKSVTSQITVNGTDYFGNVYGTDAIKTAFANSDTILLYGATFGKPDVKYENKTTIIKDTLFTGAQY